MSSRGALTGRARLAVVISVVLVSIASVLGAARLWTYIGDRSHTDQRLTFIAEQNKVNGDILVDCTTPTPAPTAENPTPAPHECYERGQRGQSGAIVELDCRSRRMQARLPAPPDARRPCTEQTPAHVYPGIAGEPSR